MSAQSTSAGPKKAILFLGATGGCGLSALKHSIAAGHICTALVRTPAKLTALLTEAEQRDVRIVQGNAHDRDAVAGALARPDRAGALVDIVIFAIGGAFDFSKFSIDDTRVCETGMHTLLEALPAARETAGAAAARPRVVCISSTGVTRLPTRDIPLLMVPLYHVMLKVPHKDKILMEEAVIASSEEWTIVRPAFLTDGEEGRKTVRAGMEDPVKGVVESSAIGYTISRKDVGLWMFENLVQGDDDKWLRKAASITH